MKIRSGFVSNSSSSSFLIPISALKQYQIEMIVDHIDATENYNKYHQTDIYCEDSERWNIDVNEKCVYGYTFMDNFDMNFFLSEIANIDQKYIHWGDGYNYDLDLDELNREIIQEQRKEKLENLENYGE